MDPERLIEGHFADELSPAEEKALRALLRESDEHRAEYDRRVRVLRQLADREPTSAEEGQLWGRIALELDAQKDAAAMPASARDGAVGRAAAARGGWLRWLPALAAIALVAGMIIVAIGPGRSGPDRSIKGGSGSAAGTGSPGLPALADSAADLEVYAIRKKWGGGFDKPRHVAPGGVLRLDDYLQFRYANREATLRYLYLGAIQTANAGGASSAEASAIDESARLYYPRPGNDTPLSIDKTEVMRGAGRSIKLSARHRAGTLVVVALFAEEAQTRATALGVLSALAAGKRDALAAWPGRVLQLRRSYLVEATPAGPGAGSSK